MKEIIKETRKEIIFITDFDHTVTQKDFYWILLDDYIGQEGIDFYYEWKKSKRIGTEFLNTVFQWKKFSDQERVEALNKVELDPYMKELLKKLKVQGIEALILSAGFDYYIDYTLRKHQIEGVEVLTNPGSFRNNTFVMEPKEDSPYYSPIYGIDKGIVAKAYKERCRTLIFVGDSEPDYYAAQYADVVFAKEGKELDHILTEKGIEHYSFQDFSEVQRKLTELGIFS